MGNDEPKERAREGAGAGPEPGRGSKAAATDAPGGGLSAIDFSTFILSLSTTALYQLGLVPEPGTDQMIEPNRVLAQQTIDTLEMLRIKTRGNLEEEEAKLFESLLYELRVRFLELDE